MPKTVSGPGYIHSENWMEWSIVVTGKFVYIYIYIYIYIYKKTKMKKPKNKMC